MSDLIFYLTHMVAATTVAHVVFQILCFDKTEKEASLFQWTELQYTNIGIATGVFVVMKMLKFGIVEQTPASFYIALSIAELSHIIVFCVAVVCWNRAIKRYYQDVEMLFGDDVNIKKLLDI